MDTSTKIPTKVIIFKYVRKFSTGETKAEFTLRCERCSKAIYGKHTGTWSSKPGAVKVANEHADMHARADSDHEWRERKAGYGYLVAGEVTR